MMRKFILCLAIVLLAVPAIAEMTQQEAKEALKDKGYLYGCTPVNWSITEPVRGGFNYAVQKGELEIMQLEKQAGLNITSCGSSLPLVAMFKNQPQALDFLLKNGYDVNTMITKNASYLYAATFYKKPESVRVLLDNGIDPNLGNKDFYPINYAIKKNQSEIVKMLLDAGAKPNEKTQKLIEKTKNQEIKSYFQKL